MKKFLIAGAAALLAIGAANAQSIKSDASEQITVVPPFSMQQQQTPLKGGMRGMVISVNRNVNTGDLDLSKAQDQLDLKDRVHATAQEACAALDAKYPQSVYVPIGGSQDCVGSASRGALAMANISDNPLFTDE